MQTLIGKAVQGDVEAFLELMDRNSLAMYKVARAILNNDDDVADAVQNTILNCFEKIHTLKKHEYFKTWLIRILINECNGILQHGKWDMIIAFPPCTYLTSAGMRHYSLRCNSAEKVAERIREREKAVDFFMAFVGADCDRYAIENPVGYMNTHWRKPDQIIHPYFFGDDAKKRTCLWLNGLPRLEPTDMLPEPQPMYICQGERCRGKKIGWCEGIRGIRGGQKERSRARSKTFPGIARAMAGQWAGRSCSKTEKT